MSDASSRINPLKSPLRFRPLLKQTIWGGRQLGTLLNKPIGDADDYAESWEIVDHGRDQSVVLGGPLEGRSLSSLIEEFDSALLGGLAIGKPARDGFPLLLKYLDCNRVLSVQVHPDDAYGQTMQPPDLGKTEAWYIVSATPGSRIYAGLQQGVDREALAAAIDAGQTEQVLYSFEPSAGDVVFIPAGTVHALGAGLVVAEIQQSSDTTFRLFDWNRTDALGKSRPLHIDSALAVTDYDRGPVQPRRSDPIATGWQTLVSCDKFVLSAVHQGTVTVAGQDRFQILTVPTGRALLEGDHGQWQLETGDSILLPAIADEMELSVTGSDSNQPPVVLSAMLPVV
ncbi:MAG: type I phosphomannose isomerase catalytic subunit [Planctomycetota bacterium]